MITHIQSGVNSRNLPPWLAQIVSERQAQLLQAARAVGDATPASKEDVARHEAGHAVIAALLGCRVKRCFIKQEYGVWGGYTEPFEPPDWSIPLHDEGLRIYTPPGCIGRAFFLFAGPFAERMKGESGIANLAADLAELASATEAIRLGIMMAMFPECPPMLPEAEAAIEPMQVTITNRLVPRLCGMLSTEEARIEAFANKLQIHSRLVTHEISPFVRGIKPIDVSIVFDELREGLPMGPLPRGLPPFYLQPAPERIELEVAP